MSITRSSLPRALADRLAAYPRIAFFSGLLLATLLAAGITQLRLETDYQVFFAPDAGEVVRFHQFQAQFGREDSLYFAVSSPADKTLFTPASLTAIGKLTHRLRGLPHVTRIASIANFPLVDAADDHIAIAPAFELEQGQFQSSLSLPRMQQRLLAETSVRHKLVSEDGRTAGLFVAFALPADERDESALRIWQAAQGLLEEVRQNHPDLSFRVTGSIALDAAFAEANERDLSILFPIAVSLIILLAALVFRSFVLYLALSLVVTAATVSSLGFAGWAGIPLSSVSLTSPVIVIIIGIAGMIHLFVAWRRLPDTAKRQRLAAAMEKILTPALLTTLTTAAGLLMLNTSATPPFQDLGNIAAFGVAMAFVYTFLLGAPLLYLARNRQHESRLLQHMMEKLAGFVSRPGAHGPALLIAGLMVATAAGVMLNKVDDNYVHYFDSSFDFRRDSDFIDARLSGIYSLEYALNSRDASVYSAAYLQAIRDFTRWALQQPGVRSVDSLEDVIAQVHRAFNNGSEQHRFAPNDDDLIAQYAMLYEMSVPRDFDFGNRVSASQRASRVTLYLANMSISEINDLEARAARWLAQHPYFAAAAPATRTATGTSIIFSHIGLNNIYSMIEGTLLLFAMASLLMWIIFRHAAIASLATLANIVPAAVTLGLWGLLAGRIGMGSAAVVTVTLGLVIDDTIHFGHRYMQLRRRGESAQAAIHGTLLQVGPAILITSLILILGFLLISLSAFEVNATMGAMVSTTILMALIFDFFVLPVALLKFDRRAPQPERSPKHVPESA